MSSHKYYICSFWKILKMFHRVSLASRNSGNLWVAMWIPNWLTIFIGRLRDFLWNYSVSRTLPSDFSLSNSVTSLVLLVPKNALLWRFRNKYEAFLENYIDNDYWAVGFTKTKTTENVYEENQVKFFSRWTAKSHLKGKRFFSLNQNVQCLLYFIFNLVFPRWKIKKFQAKLWRKREESQELF